jgi:hypothetical protein
MVVGSSPTVIVFNTFCLCHLFGFRGLEPRCFFCCSPPTFQFTAVYSPSRRLATEARQKKSSPAATARGKTTIRRNRNKTTKQPAAYGLNKLCATVNEYGL